MRISHIESRLEQQIALSKIILSSYDELMRPGLSTNTSTRIQARIATLKEDWERFSIVNEAINISIRELSNEEQLQVQQHPFLHDHVFTSTREGYLSALEKMMALQENEETTSDKSTSGQMALQVSATVPYSYQSRLPRIDLPKFDGTQSEWLPFKDLFNSLVTANPTLSPVEKLQYLKTSVIGSAAPLLSNTAITADNFQKAWEALIAFYENKRLLVNAALHSLFSIKRMNNESAAEMEQLYTKMIQIYRTMETLDRPVAFWDDILIFIGSRKLDSESVKAWEQLLGASKEPPKWHQFSEFMVTRFLTLQAYERSRSGKIPTKITPRAKTVKVHHQSKESKPGKIYKCSICAGQHYTAVCTQYQTKSLKQKLDFIQKHKLCYNCLGNHKSSRCRVTKRCQKCGRKHHTTIHQTSSHISKTKPETSTTTEVNKAESKTAPVASHSAITLKKANRQTLLATAQIIVIDVKGNLTSARALIDQGSEISLVSERLVQRLKLERHRSSIPLVGIGAELSNRTKGVVDITIKPHFKSKFELNISVHVLPKLTSLIPSHSVENGKWQHLDKLTLADPDFATSGPIDILLGADIYGIILKEGLIKGAINTPIAQNTTLGWILSGPISSDIKFSRSVSLQVSIAEELLHLLQRFWEIDTIPDSQEHTLSEEEQRCEDHFKSTHSRDTDGRYVVRLPFKEHPSKLGTSKPKAIRLISRLFDKFDDDPFFANLYSDFMTEYIKLRHMQLIPSSEPEPSYAFYLPHHGVLKDSSTTTKLRVVFNGSSKTSTGISLNDILYTGSKLQNDLFDVLIWFRRFNYVFTADIEKMYRQIQVHHDDSKFQRILWRDNQGDPRIYELQTVTYGLGCAPFLALRAVIQLVKDEGHNFPKAIPTLMKGRYVDDLFGGADSVDDAIILARQVNQLCMAGGFPLQKWASNHSSILHFLAPHQLIQATNISIEDHLVVHSLGLSWNLNTDAFEFSFELQAEDIVTKRTVLSSLAKLFDPLGLISPIIIRAKIIMQELWTIKLGWDDPLPSSITSKWILFVENLRDLPRLTFPRRIGCWTGHTVEIHGFSDALPQAIAAVVYSRWKSPTGELSVRIICAKTKVAPLKRQTIPRLELMGAVLLTKLVKHLIQTLDFADTEIFLWTDSNVTLTWINNHPSRWKDFVHNRVCFIQETLPQAKWSFIAGHDNPADLATRGLTPNQLVEKTLWWNGPSWLSKRSTEWPLTTSVHSEIDVLEERKIHVASSKKEPIIHWHLLEKYSNLNRLLRITTWCQRAVARFKTQSGFGRLDPITTTELYTAKKFWIKTVQHATFQAEFKLIKENGSLPASHSLARLIPYVDTTGILRVGGRLQASS